MNAHHDSEHITTGTILRQGVQKAWAGALWMYKIVIPVSFLTFLLEVSHVLDHLEGVLGPVMGLLHLPAKAAMPLLAGMLTGIYGGIAAMAVLTFTVKETTLIAVFLLISHALVQESAIQGQSGMHPLKAAVSRLVVSALVVWLIGWLWQGGGQLNPLLSLTTGARATFVAALLNWCLKTLMLSVQILLILLVIMNAIVWMQVRHITERLVGLMRPVLKVMGLSERVGLLWLTAVLFGISYGGAVIVDEVRKGTLPAEDLERLQLSIGINHAMIEDPSLFLPLGVHPVWLWLPRLGAAFVVVHVVRLVRRVRGMHVTPAATPVVETGPRRDPAPDPQLR